MSQSPLAPPPQTGGAIDSWLFLLWKRLTATGQLLWSSIVPGTSAEVEDVVTDATGTAGSLVFSGNPTLAGITNSGNLTFTGTGTRIVGDFSNATFANRAMWQTSTTNSTTTLGIIPNGTGPNATLNLYNNSDPTNASRLVLTCGSGESGIYSAIHGSGSYLPLGVYVNNVETARFALNGVTTFGGVSTAPALKVTPVASQARWIEVTGATSSTHPKIAASAGSLEITSGISLPLATNTGATLTITDAHHTIIQTTAASVYTLPAAASYTGRCLRFVTQFAGTVTSASSNVVPLAGGAAGTAILAATAGKWADLQSDGTNWVIVAAN